MSNDNNGFGAETIKILSDMVLVDFIIGGASGEKTIKTDDFIREVGKMLPKDAFAWVSRYRSEAKKQILLVGTARRVGSRVRGYFVPRDELPELANRLKEVRAGYIAERSIFLSSLPQVIESWASNAVNQIVGEGGTTQADIIRAKAPSRSDLERALFFELSAVEIRPTSHFGVDDALHQEVTGLAGQAAEEISQDVSKNWNGDRTTVRAVGVIERVRNKARSMSLLSERFTKLANWCDQVLATVPKEGKLDGLSELVVTSLLRYCSDKMNILTGNDFELDEVKASADVSSNGSVATVSVGQQAGSIFSGSMFDFGMKDPVPPKDDVPEVTPAAQPIQETVKQPVVDVPRESGSLSLFDNDVAVIF